MSYLPIANKSDMTTCKVNLIVPVRGVQERALVLVDARDGRPLPIVQNARRVDENVAMIVHDLPALYVLDLHIVSSLLLVPCRADDLMLCLHILVQSILPRKVVEVCIDLPRAGIDGRPIKLGLE
jgi:hypothetical protein